MATTAALLQIQVAAETTKATLALRKLDKQLTGIDKTTATATTRTSNLGKASSRAGSMLKGAAISAGSAAAAYVSIASAKAAVETTQNLASASFTLSRNLGLTTKQASRWASVAQTRDISTKQLNASFTTLAQKLTDARSGTDEAVESFEALGITQKDLQRDGGNFNKTILTVADALGKAEGGAKRQAAAAALLGRGYQTLVPIMGQGSEALREQLKLGDKYGSTMGVDAVKANMKFQASLRESERAWQGLQVQFTQALLPVLQKANKQFQRLAEIVASDKLTREEKFKRLAQIIGKWAERGFDAFIEILPKIVEKAGEAAPRVAGAFVKGFLNADVWGKLLIAGWLLSRFGGLAAFTKLGKVGGKTMGKAMGPAMLIGLALILPDLLKWAADVGQRLHDVIYGKIKPVSAGLEVSPEFRKWQKRQGIESNAPVTGDNRLDDRKRANRAIEREEERHQDDMEDLTHGGMRRVTEENKRGLDKAGEQWEKHGRHVEKTGRAAARAADKNSQRAGQNVVANTDAMVNAAGKGLGQHRDNLNKALKSVNAKTLAFKIEVANNNPGGQSGFQRGGPIDIGKPSGDSVGALLEKGEYVLNRNAAKAVGKRNLDALNFGGAKRFQRGGAAGGLNFALGPYDIPPIAYASDHAGGNSHVHVTGTTTPWTVAMGRRFQQMGWMVGEHPAFGGVTAQHSATGGHYDALAFDANTANDETRSEVAAVARVLGGAGVAGAERLKRLLLKGPGGALKDMGQRGLDRAWKANKKYLSAHTPTTGVAPVGDVSGSLQEIARRMVVSQWSASQWPYFNDLVNRESTWNPRAVNPDSGAAGLAQALPPSKYPPGAWPYRGKSSAVKQLQWMVSYIVGRYGTPASAIAFHNANDYYQRGGMVGMAAGGGVPGAPPGFEMGRFGSAHKRLAQLPGMKKRVARLTKQIAKTDERIQIQQTLAGLPTSPGGAELAGSEKTRQLGLYDRLLEQLMSQRKTARQGFRTSKHFKKNPAFFRDVLVELEGLTGGAGRLLDAKVAMAELKATPPAGTGGISIDDLLRIREGATLGLLGGLGNGLAAGGAAPAPSAGPEVNINYANGMEWLRDFVSVQVDGRDRRTNIRSLAGVRR